MDTLTAKEMTMTKEKLFKQIGDESREFTAEEYAQYELDKIESQKRSDNAAKAEAEKAALLAKLGITAEEAKLLFQ